MSAVQGCECMQTMVQNTSGGVMHFSFLPYHGRTLAAGETFLIDGDILDFTPRTMLGIRQRKAFCRAVTNGDLTIVHSPPDIGTCGESSLSSSSSSSK